MSSQNITVWIGKIFIVGVFLYFGIESIFYPETFSRLVPAFLGNIVSPEILVRGHGVVEVICGLLILFGIGGVIPLVVLILSFLGVVSVVTGKTQVRDLGILGGLLLLTSQYLSKNK